MPGKPDRGSGNNGSPPSQAEEANGTLHDLLDAALAEQRRDWTSGKRIPADDVLRQHPALASDPAQAAELVYHEFLLQEEAGACPNWEDHLRRFSRYASALRLLRQADQIVEHAFPLEPAGRLTGCFGDYELLEEIGRGGMSIVFKARQRSLDRVVALKLLKNGEYSGKEERARFRREAQAVARLQHPNIVQIHEVAEAEGEPFFSLEFVEGESLARHLHGTPIAARQAASLVEVLARAMNYAHEMGVIHRDLKPGNILLAQVQSPKSQVHSQSERPWTMDDGHWTPKVTDFGLAKRLDAGCETRSDAVLGTPSYMAPEQAEGKNGAIDRRVDVYGLGAILYELLTGRPPFRADSPLQTLKQVVEAEPARPRLLNPAVPRDLETVCLKCLQKEPSRRYTTARALAEDLRRFVNGEPVHARRVGTLGRGRRWCRRNPVLAAMAAVLALAVVGGFSGIVYQWRRAEGARRAAVAGDEEVRQLLSVLIQSSPVVPLASDYFPGAPNIEPLLKAEAHCRSVIEKDPGDKALRVALTNVYGRLGTLYLQRGQKTEMAACFLKARELWESSPRRAAGASEDRDWLATTLYWQAHAALARKDVAEALGLIRSAEDLWQELAEDQPRNLALMEKIERGLCQTMYVIRSQPHVGEAKRTFENNRALLGPLVRDDPSKRILRKRLALTCLLLGDLCQKEGSAREASSHWQEAYDHYRTLTDKAGDDLLVNQLLAFTCSRLLRGQPSDTYYVQSVALLQQTGEGMAELLLEHPGNDWLNEALLENYCCLAVCHSKVGQAEKAEETCRDHVRPLVAVLLDQRADPERALSLAPMLCQHASALWEAKLADTALPIARQAATLTSRYAAFPSRDLALIERLAWYSEEIATVLNQLKDPAASLEQAEQGRRLFEVLCRAAPDDIRPRNALRTAWTRIGKTRWDLGQPDLAMAALREAAAIQRQIFEQAPSIRQNRAELGRCYERLTHWSTLKGDLAGAAAALLEREKLWPAEAEELMRISRNFQELAQRMAADLERLSPKEQSEQQRYLNESKRTKQAAEAMARKAVAVHREGLNALQR